MRLRSGRSTCIWSSSAGPPRFLLFDLAYRPLARLLVESGQKSAAAPTLLDTGAAVDEESGEGSGEMLVCLVAANCVRIAWKS